MEEKTQEIEEQESIPKLGSGAMLSAARKKQNRSIEEIADELNLSITQIKTIELDQSDGLPEPTYVRGYIRSYANLLGLNPEEVLAHYLNKNWQKSANLDDMPRGIGDGEPAETTKFSPARVILFLAIVGLLGFFWFSGGLERFWNGSQSAIQNQSGSSVVESVSSEVVQLGDATGVVQGSDQSSLVVSDGADGSEQASEDSGEATSVAGADVAEAENTTIDTANLGTDSLESRVVLQFLETSWVDIRDEQQNRLAYQSYPAGETVDVAAEGVLSILIGNAKGVEMTLNGETYDLRPHTEGVYAKFSVGTPKE